MGRTKGGFTLPGEAGYEKLTLSLAERWGADVIRDCDGTQLSDDILEAGYDIYSTICIIRGHNAFAKAHPETLQQTFLMAGPVVAEETRVVIPLLAPFSAEQFRINDRDVSVKRWQVFDRTENREITDWTYDRAAGSVTVENVTPFHTYTVNFLAYRIWEEISMYNHVTNGWDSEHLMPLDPMYPEVQAYLLDWLETWCREHPATDVVRFTSLFYNFVWIWGSSEQNRNLFTDWGSYDFTVSDRALELFEEETGQAISSEDFINRGKLQVTHMPPSERKVAWMDFINRFVVSYGKQLIDVVHRFGKKAYVFYDDSWVGIEPYGERFTEFGFDGIIKCVFSGYEVRLCAGVPAATHEIRLHPYLFPTGLGGLPTFAEGGDPARDARSYWVRVRRALLRAAVQRTGLGGYLHLTQDFPDFVDCIEGISDEFRQIRDYHASGAPQTAGVRTAVLHYWGGLRPWTLSGHFHETYMHDLIHVNEALAGLPLDVDFISFEDVRQGKLAQYDALINCGRAGDAWSGGAEWDASCVTALTKWVHDGGILIGIGEPSALDGYDHFFRMEPVLGVDEDTGARVCHGKWPGAARPAAGPIREGAGDAGAAAAVQDDALSGAARDGGVQERAASKGAAENSGVQDAAAAGDIPAAAADLVPAGAVIPLHTRACLSQPDTELLLGDSTAPLLTRHAFGRGLGYYLAGFALSAENTRLLLNLLLSGNGRTVQNGTDDSAQAGAAASAGTASEDAARPLYLADNPYVDCAYYPGCGKLVAVNSSDEPQHCVIRTETGEITLDLTRAELREIACP